MQHRLCGRVSLTITFTILSLHQHISVAPDWPTGIALGIGGLAGGYTGSRFQSRMPDVLIRRLVGVLVIAIGAYFLSSGLGRWLNKAALHTVPVTSCLGVRFALGVDLGKCSSGVVRCAHE